MDGKHGPFENLNPGPALYSETKKNKILRFLVFRSPLYFFYFDNSIDTLQFLALKNVLRLESFGGVFSADTLGRIQMAEKMTTWPQKNELPKN